MYVHCLTLNGFYYTGTSSKFKSFYDIVLFIGNYSEAAEFKAVGRVALSNKAGECGRGNTHTHTPPCCGVFNEIFKLYINFQ
jgi:hypothetical protein